MNRILTWHYEDVKGAGERIGAAYYIEADYAPVALRIHAHKAPDVTDAEFEILDDGASLMSNRNMVTEIGYGRIVTQPTTTTVVLGKGENSEELAEDFNNTIIERGSWLTCTLGQDGGGKNFTIQMELERISEDDESEE